MAEPLRIALPEDAAAALPWEASGRPRLHAVQSGGAEEAASAADREMIEATTAALALFSAKWKVEILYLLAAGVRRNSRLQDHLLVSNKVLAEALRGLERDGLIRRRVFAEVPVRVEYSLTPLGRSLTAPLLALCEWAEEHLDDVQGAREAHEPHTGRVRDAAERLPRFTAAFQVRTD